MKVLMIALGVYGSTGGMQAFNRRVIRCLTELTGRSVEQVHLTSLWDGPDDGEAVPSPVVFFPGAKRKMRTAWDFLARVFTIRPDVILYGHVMLAPLAIAARVISPRSRQVLFVHGTEVWGDLRFRRIPFLETVAVRKCIHQVVSVSEFTAGKMARIFGLPRQRFYLLPNATDTGGGRRGCCCCKASEHAPTLLSVSRLECKDRYKGIDQVILALPKILNVVPNTRYVIVGEGSHRRELTELAQSVGVAASVDFLGHIADEDLLRCYSSASVFVLPSSGEGFGIVFLEAWRHGLPVICGNEDASPEVVTDGLNGLVVDPADVAQIAQAAVRLLTDPSFARRLGAEGYRTLSSRYTHELFRSRLDCVLGAQTCPN